jgi:hypothetical protein
MESNDDKGTKGSRRSKGKLFRWEQLTTGSRMFVGIFDVARAQDAQQEFWLHRQHELFRSGAGKAFTWRRQPIKKISPKCNTMVKHWSTYLTTPPKVIVPWYFYDVNCNKPGHF